MPPRKKAPANKLTASRPAQPLNLLKLRSVSFDRPPFRKLGSIELKIAPRVTLIAGRNGVGKSTILALIAGSSGITRGANLRTYLGALPNVNAEEILRLSYERDFVKEEAKKPSVLLTYDYNGVEFKKKGNVSGSQARLRVVPRNEPRGVKVIGDVEIPADGKVPLPTIYLGMMRVLPIGEIAPDAVVKNKASIAEEDYAVYESFTNRVIHIGNGGSSDEVTAQWVNLNLEEKNKPKKIKKIKSAMYPMYDGYDSSNVSLGQDSLSSIATALASFSMIKRKMGAAYRGGLLVIDELDAGFHPHAQVELLNELKSAARSLNIQVVATTHSLTMLEYAHQDIHNDKKTGEPQDEIIYLKGGLPIEVMDATEFSSIHDDMYMRIRVDAPTIPHVKVYVEDDEAFLFLNAILAPRKKEIMKNTGYNLKIISVRLGCGHLVGLPKADPYFKSVVIVLDADTEKVNAHGFRNIVRLPGDPRNSGKQSPEVIIESMCRALCSDADAYLETRKKLKSVGASTDYVQRQILSLKAGETKALNEVGNDRDVAKKWFNNRLSDIQNLKLIEGWIADNMVEVDSFVRSVESAVRVATGTDEIVPKKAGRVKR